MFPKITRISNRIKKRRSNEGEKIMNETIKPIETPRDEKGIYYTIFTVFGIKRRNRKK